MDSVGRVSDSLELLTRSDVPILGWPLAIGMLHGRHHVSSESHNHGRAEQERNGALYNERTGKLNPSHDAK